MKTHVNRLLIPVAALALAAPAATSTAGEGANAALECGQVSAPVPAAPGLYAHFTPDKDSAHPRRARKPTTCDFGYKRFKPFIKKCPELLPPPLALGPSGSCKVKESTVRAGPDPAGNQGSLLKIRKKLKKGYRSIEAYLYTSVPSG